MKPLVLAALALSLAACNGRVKEQSTEATATVPTNPPHSAAPSEVDKGSQMDTFAMPANLQSTPSGLQYVIDQPGTGVQPRAGQTVTVHYTGWLTNGTKFDSSRDSNQPLEFVLGQRQVIKGWDEGIGAMKIGEKRTLVIPPALGYGEQGYGGVIPANATLVFKVELIGAK